MSDFTGGSESGPGWWDVSQAVTAIKDRMDCFIEIRLMPPMRRLDGKGYTSWQAGATVRNRGEKQVWSHSSSRSFGRGGASKTAPAALLVCFLEIEAKLEAAEMEARQRAMF